MAKRIEARAALKAKLIEARAAFAVKPLHTCDVCGWPDHEVRSGHCFENIGWNEYQCRGCGIMLYEALEGNATCAKPQAPIYR